LDALVEAVGGQSLLVVLDNCEHVIGACAKLADALLRACPNLALLATSREPLSIDGERVYRVPSMSIPVDGDDAEAIRGSEAVQLLADRAAAQGVPLAWDEPAALVTGRICRRLDGIPLAVELAAARLRVMPAAELDARLDERFGLLTGGSRAAVYGGVSICLLASGPLPSAKITRSARLIRLATALAAMGLVFMGAIVEPAYLVPALTAVLALGLTAKARLRRPGDDLEPALPARNQPCQSS
jgi:hypothetical protein